MVRLLVIGLVVASIVVSGVALAEPDAEQRAAAQALFAEGRRLRAEGHCDEAVPKFVESQRLDPAVGTLLNLADCYRALGRSASAWLLYIEAASTARARADRRRQEYAERAASELEPQLLRMVIEVSADTPGLSIERNGKSVEPAQWGSPVPVDPGAQRVVASAPGYASWETSVTLSAGEVTRVVVPALVPLPEPAEVPSPVFREPRRVTKPIARHEVTTEPDDSSKAAAGWSIGAVGLAGIGVGVGFAVRSRLLVDASQKYCPDDPDVCLPAGADLRDEARTNELVAIVALATGGAAVATGVVLLITSRSERAARVRATPSGVAIAW